MQRPTYFTIQNDDGTQMHVAPYNNAGFDVAPLGLAALVCAAEGKPQAVPLIISNVCANQNLPAAAGAVPVTVDGYLELKGTPVAYGLVKGGWLPLPWAHKRTAFVDRNVIIKLEKLRGAEESHYAEGDPGWLTKWLGLDTEVINPMFFALEGRYQRLPSEWALRVELNRAGKALRKALPGANIQQVCKDQREILYKCLMRYASTLASKKSFLMHAAPMVVDPAKPELRPALERKVLALAKKYGVPIRGLLVLAVLSCIYDSNAREPISKHAKPGRKVLKPTKSYTSEMAYNALADIFFIELLMQLIWMVDYVQPVLYTRDAGIAALWTAIHSPNSIGAQVSDYEVSFAFALDNGLFPSLGTDELLGLKLRMSL